MPPLGGKGTCVRSGKIMYGSRESALEAVDYHRADDARNAYRCPSCYAWHLTKRPK